MLEGLDLSFRHTRHLPWLFERITLQVHAGEWLGITGPSGIGKSTLVRILAGALRPQEGSIVVDGSVLDLRGKSPIQLLFQHPELAVNPRWLCRNILEEGERVSEELLAELAIDRKWLDRYPHELSGGELQRICLARALAQNPRYLICDEMTSMVDALTQVRIWKAVRSLAQARRIGLLIISHDRILLQRLCKRILVCTRESEEMPMQLRDLHPAC